MKKIILLSAMASAMLTSFAAQATESAQLTVIGTIQPPPCNVNFTSGGVADYKVIKTDKLQATGYTDLEPKELPLTLDCGNKMKVAFSIVDNKAASKVIGIFGVGTGGQNFGLGMQADNKVGGYRIDMTNNLADSVSANAVSSESTTRNWTNGPAVWQDRFHSLATGALTAPVAAQKFSTTLKIYTRLNERSKLSLAEDIPMSGQATIQVEYL